MSNQQIIDSINAKAAKTPKTETVAKTTIKGADVKLPKSVTITIHKSCISYKTDGSRKAYLKGSTLELSHIDTNCQKEVKKCKQGSIIGKIKISSTSDLETFLTSYFNTQPKTDTTTTKAPKTKTAKTTKATPVTPATTPVEIPESVAA